MIHVADRNKTKLIVKKLCEHSNELTILNHLRTIQPQSPNVISFVDTVSTSCVVWLILPKLLPLIQWSLDANGAQLCERVMKFSHNVISGLAYLHQHKVVHLDIKPRNLVYTYHGSLQIIDFDSAVQAESDGDQITGLCSTRRWRAPKIGNDEEEASGKNPYAPSAPGDQEH